MGQGRWGKVAGIMDVPLSAQQPVDKALLTMLDQHQSSDLRAGSFTLGKSVLLTVDNVQC